MWQNMPTFRVQTRTQKWQAEDKLPVQILLYQGTSRTTRQWCCQSTLQDWISFVHSCSKLQIYNSNVFGAWYLSLKGPLLSPILFECQQLYKMSRNRGFVLFCFRGQNGAITEILAVSVENFLMLCSFQKTRISIKC